MYNIVHRLTNQPAVAIGTGLLALSCVVVAWSNAGSRLDESNLVLAGVLVAGLILSYRYPIHLQRGTKVGMGSVVLYLIAVLLPVPLACVTAGLSILVGMGMERTNRGLYLSDIVTEGGRGVMVMTAGSAVAHLHAGAGIGHSAPLFAAGFCLWAGDLLTAPIAFYPVTHEAPWRIIWTMLQQGNASEVYQYLLGVLGALAAMQQRWAVVLVLVPIVPVYFAFKTKTETQDSTRQVLESMADAVDLRDPYTGGHSQRVAKYTGRLLAALGIHGPEVDLIVSAARVHDIGKIGTPDNVLLKDGRLTEEERALMEQHPIHGAQLLARYKDFARGAAVVRHHHERWDGQGYPDRLKGTDIPFGARIVAIADSFDAMTSDRPYRRGMTAERAANILREGRGTQWDADLIDVFLGSLDVEAEPAAVPLPEPVPDLPLIPAPVNTAAS
jgi:HD-GYP domain-containing protein (c-di-GMP phosphodiesterase class II)